MNKIMLVLIYSDYNSEFYLQKLGKLVVPSEIANKIYSDYNLQKQILKEHFFYDEQYDKFAFLFADERPYTDIESTIKNYEEKEQQKLKEHKNKVRKEKK